MIPKPTLHRVVRSVFRLYHDFYQQQQYTKQALAPITELASFPNKKKKRVYQAASVITVSVPMSFAVLRGKPLTQKERKIQTLLAAMAPLYDDLFDEQGMAPDDIWKLSTAPYPHAHPTARAYAQVISALVNELNDSQVFYEHLHRLHSAQIESLAQATRNQLSSEELLTISYNKAGYSYVLSRILMQNPMLSNEEQAVYRLGGVSQILDDIFDLQDDGEARLDTIPLRFSITELAKRYHDECSNILTSFQSLGYESKNLHHFLTRKAYILGIASVAIKQYSQLLGEDSKNESLQNVIDNNKSVRLVCDMSSIKNIVRGLFEAKNMYSNSQGATHYPKPYTDAWLY